jgi:hypothetical protein
MARQYKRMPPLWRIEALLELSDRYSSGLQWRETNGWRKEGEIAGKHVPSTGFYLVRFDGDQYQAHRLVYYLRHRQDPEDSDVLHESGNETKDNRQVLFLTQRKSHSNRAPNKYRRDSKLHTDF